MRKKMIIVLVLLMMLFTLLPIFADDGHWEGDYWIENGVRQGTYNDPNGVKDAKGMIRGREIYDPESKAWYWLDAVYNGKKATDKEVWMPYLVQGDDNKEGKWVRYDKDGHMIKGWFTNEKGTYYYYPETGAMAKGKVTIEDTEYTFNEKNGRLISEIDPFTGWLEEDGKQYWYEKGVRQGTIYDPKGVMGDGEVRGREIYDPESKAWYWLDAAFDGAKAVNKEVWMPYVIQGDSSPEGKWVRYDEEGKMIKGWYTDENNSLHYYDKRTGMMYKGMWTVEGKPRFFHPSTGVVVQVYNEIPQEYYIDQAEHKAYFGDCGAAGLTALWTKGYCHDVSFEDFMAAMPYDDNDPNLGFVGDPYAKNNDEAINLIYPAAAVKWFNAFGNAMDASGCSAEQLILYLVQGNVPLCWVTYNLKDEELIEEEWGSHFPEDQVVIVSGYNSYNGQFLIVDPHGGYKQVEYEQFMNVWEKLKNAVIVY